MIWLYVEGGAALVIEELVWCGGYMYNAQNTCRLMLKGCLERPLPGTIGNALHICNT